ncbi:MAG: hypothetical protein PHR35_19315 [Kiritimatiellae bacterium]|nr:hypothetical protein [Kiritimatiellia bacterium]
MKYARPIRRVVALTVVAYVILFLLFFHADGLMDVEIAVRVADGYDRPVRNAELIYLERGIECGLIPPTESAHSSNDTESRRLSDMYREGMACRADSNGIGVLSGRFPVTIAVWRRWIHKKGYIAAGKDGYETVFCDLSGPSFQRMKVRKRKMEIAVTMRATNDFGNVADVAYSRETNDMGVWVFVK